MIFTSFSVFSVWNKFIAHFNLMLSLTWHRINSFQIFISNPTLLKARPWCQRPTLHVTYFEFCFGVLLCNLGLVLDVKFLSPKILKASRSEFQKPKEMFGIYNIKLWIFFTLPALNFYFIWMAVLLVIMWHFNNAISCSTAKKQGGSCVYFISF